MAHHDDFAAGSQGIGNAPVEGNIFRRTLALLFRLPLVSEVMQESMRVVGADFLL